MHGPHPMPPPALAPSGAPSRFVWGMRPENSEFPRSAPTIPARHRARAASVVATTEEFSPFGVGAAVAQRKKRTYESLEDTTCGDLRRFRGNPLAPFSVLHALEDKASVSNTENCSSFNAVDGEDFVSSDGAHKGGTASSAETLSPPLADLVSIPVGSLLLGVIAEIHSDDILVQLPDGVVGWVPRAHAFPLLEEPHKRNEVGHGQGGEKRAKRQRRDIPNGTHAAGESAGEAKKSEDCIPQRGAAEATAAKRRALERVVEGLAEKRPRLLTDHYAVGQIVQCVVIAEGADQGLQQRPDRFHSRGMSLLTLSLRPCLFNAGLTVEAIEPGMVLPASLVSEEDHGYSFSIGVSGISAFLPSGALQQCSVPLKARYSSKPSADTTTTESSPSLPVSVPLHSILSLRVDRVKVAAKVLLCSLPALNKVKHNPADWQRQLSELKGQQYVALSQRVAWASIRPGCLVEARVQHVYTRGNSAEKYISGTTTAGIRAGNKTSSLANCAKDVSEDTAGDVGDIIGVRVVCLGGIVNGTLLQPHFGHPLLLQFESDRSFERLVTALKDPKERGRKLNKQANGGAAEEEKFRGGPGRKHEGEYNSEEDGTTNTASISRPRSGIHLSPRGEQIQKKEAGQRLTGKAGENISASTPFKVIQERYRKDCLSRFRRVGARMIARVTCVLSNTRDHVYLSMLPHILTWRPCSLPCSIPELLPGRFLLGAAAHILSVSPLSTGVSHKSFTPKKKNSVSTAQSTGDGDIRVLLLHKRKIDGIVAQQSSRSFGARGAKKKSRLSSFAEDDVVTSHAPDVCENPASGDATSITGDSGKRTAGCAISKRIASEAAQDEVSGDEDQAGGWVLVRIPKCVMATVEERFRERKKDINKRAESNTRTEHEEIGSGGMRLGDVFWSASKESDRGDCFCRVLYFDRFAGEVVGGNSARLIKRGVVLSPFDVAPGQILTVSVLRWRLPVERQKLKQQKRDERLQPPSAGIYVGLSPYLSAFVPLHQLTDTPLSSFPPHVVPGSSLRLRVLGRVCCKSCTDLDREAAFAPLLRKSWHKLAAACQSDSGSNCCGVRGFQCVPGSIIEGLACGSAMMGIGGGGGGRLLLTGKESLLNDRHPLTSVVNPKAFYESMGDAQACCMPVGLITVGYVQELYYRKDLKHRRNGVEEAEDFLPSITVGFYGGLTARLSEDGVRRAVVEEGRVLKLGTVVKVRILGVDTRHRCLRATLDLTIEAAQSALATARRKRKKTALRLSSGGVVEKERLTLLALTDKGVFVAVEEKKREVDLHAFPGAASAATGWRTPLATAEIHSTKSVFGCNSPHIPHVGIGFIPKLHLSDGVRLAEELYSVLQVGERFPLDVVVLSSTAAVRPGAPVLIWKMPKALMGEKASKGGTHVEGGLEGALARLTCAVQQQDVTNTDGLDGEHAPPALLRDTIILSCKSSLKASAANGIFLRDCKAIEKLKTELSLSLPILWGYVRKIGAYGLLVSFGAWQLTGLVPYSNLSDTFIEDESHLRRLYREGMTVRGCIVAVNDATDEDSGQGERTKHAGLRYIVDIRPKRLNYLQRHRQMEGGARAAASVGIQTLQGLLEGRLLAAALKRLKAPREVNSPVMPEKYDERSEKTKTDASVEHGITLKGATSASGDTGDLTSFQGVEKDITITFLRPGQLIWGRVLSQGLPNCVLLELHPPGSPGKEGDNMPSKCCLSTFGSITGVVLEHQLPEGETVSSLQARAQGDSQQSHIPCIILDFDPVTGIADVSCRRRLVSPLYAAQNAIEEAARSAANKFVHYILLGVSTTAGSEPDTFVQFEDSEERAQKSAPPCDVPRVANEPNRVRRRRIEVVTRELDELLQKDSADQSRTRTRDSLDEPSAMRPEATSGVGQRESFQHMEEAASFRAVKAVPETVIQRVQSFCEAQPAPSAIVQLENAAYSVLSADFDVIICFSSTRRLGQKRLERLTLYATPYVGGESAKSASAIPLGGDLLTASLAGKSATHFNVRKTEADGLYIRLPLILFSSSCHNNTLLPVQPAAKALREAPEDAGWRVALSPLQRSFHLQRDAFAVSVLLAGGCWSMRKHKLERQQNFSQRRDRMERTGIVDREGDAAEADRNLTSTKKMSVSQLGDAVERTAAPGQILRARVAHVSACMALARLKTPREQLLLRLHAADALPPPRSAQAAHDVLRTDATFLEMQGERLVNEWENLHGTPEPEITLDRLQGSAYTGEEHSQGEVIERTSWFPPGVSPSASSKERLAPVWKRSNPLKRFTPGMLVAVRVLQLRAIVPLPAKRTASVKSLAPTGRLQAAADDGQCNNEVENRGEGPQEKSLQETGTSQSTKNRWVADVELVGWFEKKTRGKAGKAHYAYVSNNASPLLTGRLKPCPESDEARAMRACIYSPRWAVVEAACARYLTIHCGVRGVTQGGVSSQQLPEASLWENGNEGARKFLSGKGRVYRLDASRERHVLQNLKVHFAPGDMVCVRLLPILSLEEDAFVNIFENTTRGAAGAGEELTRKDFAHPDKQLDYEKPRPPVIARYTLVPCPAGMAESLSPKAVRTEEAESSLAGFAATLETVPVSLVQTTFDTIANATGAWTRWRYPPGVICWGVVHRMLPPPFAVAVQLCEVVIKTPSKSSSSVTTGEDNGLLDDEEERGQMRGIKRVSSSRTREFFTSLPVLAAVHLTEVTDAWLSDPVQRLKLRIGQLVKVRILPVAKTEQMQQPLKCKKTASRSGLPLEASMRISVVEKSSTPVARTSHRDDRLLTFDHLKVGDRVTGIVVSAGNAGVFVAVSRYLTLRIKLQNLRSPAPPSQKLSEKSLSVSCGIITGAAAEQLYPVGMVIRAIRVLELHPDSRRIEGTLRDEIPRSLNREGTTNEEHILTNVNPKHKDVSLRSSVRKPVLDTLSPSLEVGDDCEGRVKAIQPYGVFVTLLNPQRRLLAGEEATTTDALCHISNVGGETEAERKSILEKLKLGDLVKARVIKKDRATGRVCISLDPGIFDGKGNSEEDFEEVPAEVAFSEFENQSWFEDRKCLNDSCDKEKKQTSLTGGEEGICTDTKYLYTPDEACWTWSGAVSATDGMDDEGREALGTPFTEIEDVDALREESDGRALVRGPTGVKVFENTDKIRNAAMDHQERAARDDKRRGKEEEIRLAEEENSYRSWMENPRTAEDFEKLVLVSGNSASVWISYMAYYVELGDVARARQVAERAVLHINYREEQQRFDVWVAYLNLECTYGGAVESVFKRAIQYNDAKKMYYQMTFIYERAQKLAEARSACESCCYRFPQSQKMWVRHLTLLYGSVKDVPAARELMLQALLRLPRRKHVAFAACCARLEYKFGSKERGQTFFEKLVAEHPRRTDLWSQYIDAHICAHTPPRCQPADLQGVRLLFARATSLQLKPRKMKFFFTRWLVFEKRHGTVDSQALVRERAKAYVLAMEARLAEQQAN